MDDTAIHETTEIPAGMRAGGLADLPPPETKRWVIRRKAAVVTAVRRGVLSGSGLPQRRQQVVVRHNGRREGLTVENGARNEEV